MKSILAGIKVCDALVVFSKIRIPLIQVARNASLISPIPAKALDSRVNLGYSIHERSKLANGVDRFQGMRQTADQRAAHASISSLKQCKAGVILLRS